MKMSKTYNFTTPITEEQTRQLKAGDIVFLNGEIFTARDAAHKKLVDLIEAGEELPFELKGSIIYFVGPTPPKPGDPIGSAGPTTSYRMDSYSPTMLKNGSLGMIGKGKRNQGRGGPLRHRVCEGGGTGIQPRFGTGGGGE